MVLLSSYPADDISHKSGGGLPPWSAAEHHSPVVDRNIILLGVKGTCTACSESHLLREGRAAGDWNHDVFIASPMS